MKYQLNELDRLDSAPLNSDNLIFSYQMYGLIWLTQIPSKVRDCDVLVMLTSALCHDLDHPGYNNAYQVI